MLHMFVPVDGHWVACKERIMDFRSYYHAAKRTMNSTLSREMQLCTAALGICGEVGEVLTALETSIDIPNRAVINELGDVCWYITWSMELFDITMLHSFVSSPENDRDVYLLAAQFADIVKKIACHQHPMTATHKATIIDILSRLHAWVCDAATWENASIYDVYEANIAKLQQRFATEQGFTSEESISRADTVAIERSTP